MHAAPFTSEPPRERRAQSSYLLPAVGRNVAIIAVDVDLAGKLPVFQGAVVQGRVEFQGNGLVVGRIVDDNAIFKNSPEGTIRSLE